MAQEANGQHEHAAGTEHAYAGQAADSSHDAPGHEGHAAHGLEFTIVFIVCVTLVLGAAMRLGARITKIPFTIMMLLLGLVVGMLLQHAGAGPANILAYLAAGKHITADLIIFAFLPALVFESAYAMDVYAFKRNLGGIALLAVPALLLATVATAAMMFGLTRVMDWNWGWPTALVFGAMISATDPVAVVSILKELGAPKRLGVLIEGESLLNDGTAIVVFFTMLALLTTSLGVAAGGDAGGGGVGTAILDFGKVAGGGVAVGFVLAIVFSSWIGRTFNDATSEITLTICLAYACMLIGEGLFHVSGVLAIVVAGLYMGGPGRTRVSPEVQHFLHEFWQVVAYIANTLIFFLVGLVIASTLDQHGPMDLLLVVLCYLGIVALRFVLTFAFKPVIAMVGEPISTGDATCMSWAGLRGAVSLALALIVQQKIGSQYPKLGSDILFITAGVCFLTILVNGSTMAWMLRKFGLDQPPPTEREARLRALASVLDDVKSKIKEVSQSRELRTVSWGEVEKQLEQRRDDLEQQIERVNASLAHASDEQRAAGYWQQVLSTERQVYWSAFGQGTLSPLAARILDRDIDAQLDRLRRGNVTPPETRMSKVGGGGLFGLWARWRGSDSGFGVRQFNRLALVYDMSRAESLAAEKVLAGLDDLKGVAPQNLEQIRRTYRDYLRTGKERLEDLRSNLPEVTQAIETRLAKRIRLNFERAGIRRIVKTGALSQSKVQPSLDEVEREMKQLHSTVTKVALPRIADLCRATALFKSLDDSAIKELGDMTVEQVLHQGEVLCHEGDTGDSMYIIARGAVHVLKLIDGEQTLLNVQGGGDIIGEMSLLTGAPRTTTIRAATTVTLGVIDRESFGHLLEKHPAVHERVWDTFAAHRFDDYTRSHDRYQHLSHDERMHWIKSGHQSQLAAGKEIQVGSAEYVFVVLGSIDVEGLSASATTLVSVAHHETIRAVDDCRVVLLPGMDEAIRRDEADG